MNDRSINDLHQTSRLTFEFPFKPDWSQVVHVFLAKAWQGDPEESDEMKPTWCRVDQIPFESMWDDASYWLPLVLKGKRIEAGFVYKDDSEAVGEVKIEEWVP